MFKKFGEKIVSSDKLKFKYSSELMKNSAIDIFVHEIAVCCKTINNKSQFEVIPGNSKNIKNISAEEYCIYSVEVTKDDFYILHLRIPSYSIFAGNTTSFFDKVGIDYSASDKALEIGKLYCASPRNMHFKEFNKYLAKNIIITSNAASSFKKEDKYMSNLIIITDKIETVKDLLKGLEKLPDSASLNPFGSANAKLVYDKGKNIAYIDEDFSFLED